MVTKTRASLVEIPTYTNSYTITPPASPPKGNVTIYSRVCNKSATYSGSVPYYKRKIATGSDATSSYVGSQEVLDIQEGYYEYERVTKDSFGNVVTLTHEELRGNAVGIPAFTYPGSVSTSAASNQAIQKFVAKCRAEQQALQSLVVAGEFAETLHMLRNPAEALWNAVLHHIPKAKRRRNRSRARNRVRVVANSWLEASFGWAPLINDVRSAAKALGQLMYQPPEYKYIRAQGQAEFDDPQPTTSSFNGLRVVIANNTKKTSCSVYYRGVVGTTVPYGPRSLGVLGLTWSEVLPAAWELIPYSFMVDYFTNIGKILDANAFNNASLRWWNSTVVKEGVNTNTGSVIPNFPLAHEEFHKPTLLDIFHVI
jgi:hypothetical protein